MSACGVVLVVVFAALVVFAIIIAVSLAYAAGMERGCTRADEE